MCGVTSVHSHQTRTMTSQGYVYLLWPRYCLILLTFQLNFNAQSTQQNLCLLLSSESWLEVGRRLVFALKQTLVNFRYQKLIREFFVTSHFMGINPRIHFCGLYYNYRQTVSRCHSRQVCWLQSCWVVALPMLTQLLSVRRPPRVCSKYQSVHVSLSPQLPRYWILLFITYLQF